MRVRLGPRLFGALLVAARIWLARESMPSHTLQSRHLLRPGLGPSTQATGKAIPLLEKGFRPFFLGAAAFAALALPLWLAVFAGVVSSSVAGVFSVPMYWHAHEMIYGFALAVITGFLLTAASNWTGRETLIGGPLALLVALWVAGRVLLTLPIADGVWRWTASLLDLLFAPLVALAVARPILAAKSRRNFGFLAILSGFAAGNLLMHLGAMGVVPEGLALGSRLGVNLTLLAIVVMTGRVVPMFTRNATGDASIRSLPAFERASVVAMLLVLGTDLVPTVSWVRALVSLVAGALVLLRASHWGFSVSLRQPLLWVLHLGHAWVPAGLLLKGASLLGAAWAAWWLHALTLGGIGLLTLGMMVRVSLGHTGRMLAAPRSAVLAFAALALAALVRVAGPALLPAAYLSWLVVSGALWSGAFIAFLVGCAPMLLRARVDGRPG